MGNPAADRLTAQAAGHCVLLFCVDARHSSWQTSRMGQGSWCIPLELHDAALRTGKQQSPTVISHWRI